jgi:hypothetical protein
MVNVDEERRVGVGGRRTRYELNGADTYYGRREGSEQEITTCSLKLISLPYQSWYIVFFSHNKSALISHGTINQQTIYFRLAFQQSVLT